MAKPGREGVKADWLATWRNWVRREAPPGSARRGGNGGAALAARNRAAVETWLGAAEPGGAVIDGACHHEG
ncbi:hypothetical protein CKO17_16500 [Marichromatium gracile]|nr:hypothetical protein [Marichromatium gracile]